MRSHQIPTDFKIELEQEEDGRWIAEVLELPGVLVYGATEQEAIIKVQALALQVVADQLEHGESDSAIKTLSFSAANLITSVH
ncbi:type II toxin-antitoxin system HicB family antitoxin [Leptolyngbyaceae cyanobacterium UHCC 1019]